jgi:hypothetical protein
MSESRVGEEKLGNDREGKCALDIRRQGGAWSFRLSHCRAKICSVGEVPQVRHLRELNGSGVRNTIDQTWALIHTGKPDRYHTAVERWETPVGMNQTSSKKRYAP